MKFQKDKMRRVLVHIAAFALLTFALGIFADTVKPAFRLIGLWRTSRDSYEAALKSTVEMVLIEKDFTFRTGSLNPKTKKFTEDEAAQRDPEFKKKLELSDGILTFHLDGADEHSRFIADGPDRFKLIVQEDPPAYWYFVRAK